MDRWAGRVALVTGASSGIGAAIALALVNRGMQVIGCARNIDKITVSLFYAGLSVMPVTLSMVCVSLPVRMRVLPSLG